jgi:hypothetical protein
MAGISRSALAASQRTYVAPLQSTSSVLASPWMIDATACWFKDPPTEQHLSSVSDTTVPASTGYTCITGGAEDGGKNQKASGSWSCLCTIRGATKVVVSCEIGFRRLEPLRSHLRKDRRLMQLFEWKAHVITITVIGHLVLSSWYTYSIEAVRLEVCIRHSRRFSHF